MISDRRTFLKWMIVSTGISTLYPHALFAQEPCMVQHPLQPPDAHFSEECHNCGMYRSMWARTWHTYTSDNKEHHVCSLHCLTEAITNSAASGINIKTALYLAPATMIPVKNAHYVVGSKARGTMSMKSKLAFASADEANKFIKSCGGKLADFDLAYKAAAQQISSDNAMINSNRLRKGKIVEPTDNLDRCPICGMYPARYPQHKCQLTLANGKVVHFCATHCLFKYLGIYQEYTDSAIKNNQIWVIDYATSQWVYAQNAYYLIGTDVKGPMGKEALPFINKRDAQEFQAKHGGKILNFANLGFTTLIAT